MENAKIFDNKDPKPSCFYTFDLEKELSAFLNRDSLFYFGDFASYTG